jgi:predicted DNA-binding transcriptional regulator AlpA
MTVKPQDALSYPPRAMRLHGAAAYLSMSKSAFLRLIEEGKLPSGIHVGGMVLWDRLELDAAFENLKEADEDHPDDPSRKNTIAAILESKR